MNKGKSKDVKSKFEDTKVSKGKGSSKHTKPNGNKGAKSDVYRESNTGKATKGREWISTAGKPTNDPQWYMNNPILSRDAGTLFFSKPTGSLFQSSTNAWKIDPGIFVLDTMLNWGGNNSSEQVTGHALLGNSALNVTAQKLYQFVVHANSRNVSYDKKDLMLSIMAIDGVYSVISEAVRAYRLISVYDPQNMYIDKLITAAGWDVSDLRANVAQFRYYINTAIQRVNRFFYPNLFDITKLHINAYANIYYDRPSSKSQLFLEKSAGVWVYDDEHGVLDYNTNSLWSSALRTVSVFNDTINLILSLIENSQYMGIMQGDMLKAFGVESMAQLGYINIDEPIVPIYDEEFLFKLHNAYIPRWYEDGTAAAPFCRYRDDVAVSGNLSCIVHKFDFNYSKANSNYGAVQMYDLPAGIEPSSENILLMSQHKWYPNYSMTGGEKLLPDSESITSDYWAMPLNPDQIIKATVYYIDSDETFTSAQVNTFIDWGTAVGLMSRFSVCPKLDVTNGPFIWNTDNVLQLNTSKVVDINRVSLWSLWSSSAIVNSYREGNTKV